MTLLLDSHTLIWAVDQPSLLGSRAAIELQNEQNKLVISAATLWEISIKVGLKKLGLSLPYKEWIKRGSDDLGLSVLPITAEYAGMQISLPFYHRDPFDRLLVAQALVDDISIASSDSILSQYGVKRIWD